MISVTPKYCQEKVVSINSWHSGYQDLVFGISAGMQVAMAGLQVGFIKDATIKGLQLPLFKLVAIFLVDILMFRGQVWKLI